MPIKRTKAKPRRAQITEDDFAAFLAGEGLALHRALGLRPWEFAWPAVLTEAEDGKWTVAELMERREEIEAALLSGSDRFDHARRFAPRA